MLVQVVTNLLANAIKFVSKPASPQVHIWTEDEHDCVRFCICDNGIGIDPRQHEHIFQMFERLHGREKYPGSGVGLAIVHRAVERINGQVGVESAPGQGSTFWLKLPKAG